MSLFDDGVKSLVDGNFQNALANFEQIIQSPEGNIPQGFDLASVYHNCSLCFAMLGLLDHAIEAGETAVALEPNSSMMKENLGMMYRDVGEFQRSNELLEGTASHPHTLAMVGLNYWELQDLNKAIYYFKEALAFDPNNVNMHVNIGLANLALGNYKEGFEEYEHRIEPHGPAQYYLKVYDQSKRWQGQDIKGHSLLVYGEQGFGDVIQFSRYIHDLQDMGIKVVFHCPKALNPIFEKSFVGDDLFNANIETMKSEELPQHDFHCPSMSLPHLLKKYEVESHSYLCFKPIEWKQVGFKVVVAWAGSSIHPNDARRSIPIDQFKTLFDLSHVQFQSVQFDAGHTVFKEFSNLTDCTPSIKDFGDTAALLCSGVDLVICCDTAIAHLAGAMGVPCWVIAAKNADWRWGISNKTDWYQSVNVYRQTKHGDWGEVLLKVKEDLNQKALDKSNFSTLISHERILKKNEQTH